MISSRALSPRALRVGAAAVFATQFAALDLALRGSRAFADGPSWFFAALTSVAFGALFLSLEHRARAGVAVALGLVFSAQLAFGHYWHVAIDRQILASAIHNAADVRAAVAPTAARLALLAAVVVCVELGLSRLAPVVADARVRLAAVALLLLGLLLGPPLRKGTPEVAFADALTHVVAARVRRGTPATPSAARTAEGSAPRDQSPVAVPAVSLPNVVFILTESVRASDACSAPDQACATMPEMHALFPERVPLREMRAISSYTAVSLNALATGRVQTGDRASALGAPTMFELVRRVRASERRPFVAYWSAQMGSVFEREDIPRNVDSFVSVETLLGHAIEDDDKVVDLGVDRLLVQHAKAGLARLPRPFFLFLQLSGTHAPYFVDDKKAPFTPWSRIVSWSTLDELHNAYKNAIVAQDAALAELMRHLVEGVGEAPLVVFYTSDHGEAFGEHSAIHHGQNLYQEQIHVPAWVTSRNGGLSPSALQNLRAHERALVTHLDLLPSLLDVYGARGAFLLRDAERHMVGRSLFQPHVGLQPLPMTNCTALFPCPLNAWGMLGEDRSLAAQVWDPDWRCVPLAEGAASTALPGDACDGLRRLSRDHFPLLPNGAANR